MTTPWDHIILGSLLVQIVAFSGVALSAALHLWQRLRAKKGTATTFLDRESIIFRILIPSFATGAITATAVFLLIPESFHYFVLGTSGGEEHHRLLSSEQDHGDHEEHDLHDEYNEHDLHEEHDLHDEHDESFVWKFGTCVLSGFVFPAFLSILFPRKSCCGNIGDILPNNTPSSIAVAKDNNKIDESVNPRTLEAGGCDECSICNNEELEGAWTEEEEGEEQEQANGQAPQGGVSAFGDHDFASSIDNEEELSQATTNTSVIEKILKSDINWTLAFTTLLGDSLCNFVDGIFIGTAFLLCDQSTGYSIVATTIYHELAQEISDYTILTQECGFTPLRALAANFAAGTFVLIGAVIVATLEVSNAAIGCILAFSAGVYLYLVGVELLSKVISSRKRASDSVAFFTFIVFGAVPIGLVLLNHGHCE